MKRAIVLGGGGTKGAYEVGVWKALREQGIEYQIVTGTSIGSINGALMASGEYEKAMELWDTITMENMMEDGINLTETIDGILEQKQAIRPFLKKYVKNKGADISPFAEFIERMIDEEKVRQSDVDYGLVTVQFPSLKEAELTKSDIPKGELKEYILASSAIFPLFPMHKIGEVTYLDGCYHDNVPIDLAIHMGAEEIIAVDLHMEPAHPGYAKRPYVTYITPTKSLGTMMNCDRQLLSDNREMGYQDAMKVFGQYKGYLYTFTKDSFVQLEEKMYAFTALMAKAEALISDGNMGKRFGQADMNRIFSEIEAGLGGKKPTREDYFVRSAEIAGEIYDIDMRPVYVFNDYLCLVQGGVLSREECMDVEFFQRKDKRGVLSKLAEWKLKKNSSYITSCIYYGLQEQIIESKEQLELLTLLPRELIAATFLYVCGN